MNCIKMPGTVYIFCLTLGLYGVPTTLCTPVPLSSGSDTDDPDWEDTSPEEGPFLEGDIVTGSEIIPVVEFKASNRNLVANPRLLWPQNTLYYEFSTEQFQGELRTLVEEALKDIMEQSCVRFSPRGEQTTYLKLKGTGKGCNSNVGYPEEEGPPTLQVAGRKCHTLGTVQHEFLHALGLWHEHTRADRDDYVTVVWDNVRTDRKSNFVKRSDKESAELLKLPYDYGSVMHYKKSSFTKHRGSSTLVPTHKEAVKVMGQRVGMTRGDIAKLNRLYNCTGTYYKGEDLERSKYLLGQYYKPGYKIKTEESEEEFDFGDVTRSNNQQNNLLLENTTNSFVQNESIKSEKSGDHVSQTENSRLKEIEKRKHNVNEQIKGEIGPMPNGKVCSYEYDKSTGNQKIINVIKSQGSLDKLSPCLENDHHNDSSRKQIMDKEALSSIGKAVDEYDPRIKRETESVKFPGEGKSETADQKSNENSESFAPQKILPELLKGVLNSENDRPIVIQFAIYQPIVYKSLNQSESSSEENKDGNASHKNRENEHNRHGNERIIHNKPQEPTQEKKPVKSTQKVQNFDEDSEDGSSLTNRKFSESSHTSQPEDDDRIDTRSFYNREPKPFEQNQNYNRKTDEVELSTELSKFRKEQLPEHETEYIPISKNHEITVSKKEYFVSPYDSHENGKEFKVSQTDYKIERKDSQHPNSDFSQHADHLSQDKKQVQPPEVDHFTSSDIETPETSYFDEGREYDIHSPKIAHVQPQKSPHRESGYESSSLIHFSQGKGTKSTYQREDNNNFHHQTNDPHEEPPLELKQGHEEYNLSPHDSQERKHKVSKTKDDYDIAPDFYEQSGDDLVLQPTTSQNPTNVNEELKEDNVSEVEDYYVPPNDETVDLESHKNSKHAKESVVYDSKSSDTFAGARPSTNGNVRDNIFGEEIVKNKKADNIPNVNTSVEKSRGTSNRREEKDAVPKPPKARDEEESLKSQEQPRGSIVKGSFNGKKRTRPDIIIEDDFSSELDIDERRKKLEKMNRKSDDTSEIETPKSKDVTFINRSDNRNKNRTETNVRSTVVRKKTPNTRIEPEEEPDFLDEDDLISKPQTSKLNLNPKQALPLRTFVNMGKKPF